MGSPPEMLFAFRSPSQLFPPFSPFPSACIVFQDLQYFCNFSISLVLSLQLSKFIYFPPHTLPARALPTNTQLFPGSRSPASHPSSAPGPLSLPLCTR